MKTNDDKRDVIHSALLADTLRQMIELIEAHEVTCFSCDRDGELYCDCLKRMVKDAKAKL